MHQKKGVATSFSGSAISCKAEVGCRILRRMISSWVSRATSPRSGRSSLHGVRRTRLLRDLLVVIIRSSRTHGPPQYRSFKQRVIAMFSPWVQIWPLVSIWLRCRYSPRSMRKAPLLSFPSKDAFTLLLLIMLLMVIYCASLLWSGSCDRRSNVVVVLLYSVLEEESFVLSSGCRTRHL